MTFTPHSRIAPTPSGYLHLGNAVAFVLNWALVRAHGGTLRLRIDDLDAPRMRPEFVVDLFEQLEWLGIDWDHGPQSPDEQERQYSQRHRLDRYREVLARLAADTRSGVYACDCSRTEVRALSPDGIYPGTCRARGLSLGAVAGAGHSGSVPGGDRAWRIHVPEGTEARFNDLALGAQSVRLDQVMGDFVILRRDNLPAYHLASLVDDLDFGIDLIVRGMDLHDSTAAQIHLASRLSLSAPEGARFAQTLFCHHPLLSDPSGGKLSKSRDSSPLKDLRSHWKTPEPVYRAVGAMIGVPEVATARELVDDLAARKSLVFSK